MNALDVYCLYTYFELITRALLNIMSNLEFAIEQGFSFELFWCRQVHLGDDMIESDLLRRLLDERLSTSRDHDWM
jgi:hypothetical protein